MPWDCVCATYLSCLWLPLLTAALRFGSKMANLVYCCLSQCHAVPCHQRVMCHVIRVMCRVTMPVLCCAISVGILLWSSLLYAAYGWVRGHSIKIRTGSTETVDSVAQNPQAEVKRMSCRAVDVLQAPKPLWGAAVLVGTGVVCYKLRRLLDTYRPSLQQHMHGGTPNCFATHSCHSRCSCEAMSWSLCTAHQTSLDSSYHDC